MTPKILPSLLMAAGSLMLAWRMKYLLDALMRAQLCCDPLQHVARTQKIGVWLSVLGFVMIGASGLLNACLLWAGF